MNENTMAVHAVIRKADENLTVKELWEKTSKVFSLSHVYYLVRRYKLPFKKMERTKPFRHLKALQEMETKDMTINQMMVKLNLSTRNDYQCVLNTLKSNGLPFKNQRATAWDFRLLALDTTNMSIDEISKAIGMEHGWQTNKLYEILPKLGKTYKSRKKG
ncbi:TPA: hypothetical protein ACQVKY_005275 [Serratia marcescens]|uniref:Uncharacterized protein n=1 Tax=Serratia nevei TaxID=2703794 RepID=A0ABT7G5U8_9GAMM|nr:hypothetical protein [Serratia nevei]HAU4290859.1 hypothetical protein [Serratia marcescens]MDK5169030.1 hypothetical protein [Serratia nevei]MDK5298524.1 hypothetical protein [Serratia nevei]MEC5887224.1 hypothetical protein [Serratia nevei]HAU4297487.1 hypothetical protein [Serratia marcescens]